MLNMSTTDLKTILQERKEAQHLQGLHICPRLDGRPAWMVWSDGHSAVWRDLPDYHGGPLKIIRLGGAGKAELNIPLEVGRHAIRGRDVHGREKGLYEVEVVKGDQHETFENVLARLHSGAITRRSDGSAPLWLGWASVSRLLDVLGAFGYGPEFGLIIPEDVLAPIQVIDYAAAGVHPIGCVMPCKAPEK